MQLPSCPICDAIFKAFQSSIHIHPLRLIFRPIGRQNDGQPDTTHHNTTSQRRDHLSASSVETLDVSAPASGVTLRSTDCFSLKRGNLARTGQATIARSMSVTFA